jgi:hypothetical protein
MNKFKEAVKYQKRPTMDEFPQLTHIGNVNTNNDNLAYGNLFKNTFQPIEKQDKEREQKIGYTILTKDKTTGKTNFYYNSRNPQEKIIENVDNTDEISNIYEIINDLTLLHEKRTEQFIEINGYDTWEKMFKYPNWDTELLYDDEMEEEEEIIEEDMIIEDVD